MNEEEDGALELASDLEDFKTLACTYPYRGGYVPPRPEEVDQLIKLAGWSQNDAAKLVGVTFHPKKGSSTIRKWRTSADKADSRAIPYSAWRLLLAHAGVVEVSPQSQAINMQGQDG